MTLGLQSLITYNPWLATEATPLDELIRQAAECDIHHWPVVDGQRRVIGAITDAELARAAQMRSLAQCGGGGDMDGLELNLLLDRRTLAIDETASPREALGAMLGETVSALAVLRNEQLVGLVSTADFLREFSYGELACARESAGKYLEKVADPIPPDATLEEALLALLQAGETSLPVGTLECGLGAVSLRQLAQAQCRLANGTPEARRGATLRSLLKTTPVIRISHKAAEAANLMLTHNVNSLAVVNPSGRLLGIVRETALLRAMLGAL